MECDWTIKLHEGHHVLMEFQDLDLPPANIRGVCDHARVSYGGYDTKGHRVMEDQVCGAGIPKVAKFASRSRWAWVNFLVMSPNHEITQFRGFWIKYHMVEEGKL